MSDPTDVQGFSRALLRVFDDAQLAERLSRGGMELAQRLTWERVVAETESVYDRVLAR